MEGIVKIMKRSIILLGGIALLSIFPFSAMAANFPTRPVTLIVPFLAGTATDVFLRVLAETTSKHLGQPVIIENKPGGAGTVGPATMAASAKPDGYTIAPILITMFRYPHMMKVTFDPLNDFTYILNVSGYTFGVVVKGDAPWKAFDQLVAYAKANPGKVTYATPGTGGTTHITMEIFGLRHGIKWIHVPTKGSSESIPAVLGGHVTCAADAPMWASMVDSGDLRLLVTWGEKRTKSWPNVPTLKDLGYDVVSNSPFGLAGPKGMDPKVVKILHDAFKKGMEDPPFLKILDKYNMEPLYKNTEDYVKLVNQLAKEEKENMEKLGLTRK
jgi:tripartite-type tricarboxylate transporter receptor subunit TctC